MKKPTAKKSNYGMFGNILNKKRIENRIGLREICREVNFDPSNWSKIERGKMSPPSDEKTLALWAKALKIEKNSDEHKDFIESAYIAQGIIPITLSNEEVTKLLPAFLRTVRNKKPTKEELDNLIQLIKDTN